jgi:hypothetical protein
VHDLPPFLSECSPLNKGLLSLFLREINRAWLGALFEVHLMMQVVIGMVSRVEHHVSSDPIDAR